MDVKLQMQAFTEVANIHRVLETVIFPQRPCKWNNKILIEKQNTWLGIAYFDGRIGLQADLLSSEDLTPLLRATVIHEMLHMFSVGYEEDIYHMFIGWEEGVVEKLQRLVRPLVLKELGYEEANTPLLFQYEDEHIYSPYIHALEAIRQLLEQNEADFYYELHSLPLNERPFEILRRVKEKYSRGIVEAVININDLLLTNITKPVKLVRY